MSGSEDDAALEKKRSRSSSSDDNSKDEPIQSRLRVKKTKASNIYSSSSEEEVSDDDKKKKKKKTAKGKKPPAKSAKAKMDDDDIEEGEVSNESEEDSSEEVEFKDGYDENLLGDDDDRERLARMTEREREEEIFKRLEHRQAMQRRLDLERKLRKRAGQTTQGKGQGKGKASSSSSKGSSKGSSKTLTNAVDDTSARSKERRLMVEGKMDTKAKAIEDLRAAREEKKSRAAEAEKKKTVAKPRKRKETESTDDEDEEEEEEEEEDLKDVKRKQVDESSSDSDDEESAAQAAKERSKRDFERAPLETLAEMEKIRLSRFRLSRWLYLPIFPQLVKGFFVRVNFGDMENGRPVYRIAEILGVGQCAKPYEIGGENGVKPVVTDITLRLRVFEREKEMNMTFISNQPITEKEFAEFRVRMESREMPLPSHEDVERKTQEATEANKYQMTDSDITTMLRQKDKLGTKPKNIVLRKAELVKMRDSALRMNETEEARKIQEELDGLEVQTKERDAPRQAGQTKIEAINRRNKSAAMEALGKALSNKDIKTERGTEDPFTRRWGTPLLVHKKGEKEKGVVTPSDVVAPPSAVEVAPSAVAVKADPFNVHNFAIDLNLDLGDFALLPSSSFTRRNK